VLRVGSVTGLQTCALPIYLTLLTPVDPGEVAVHPWVSNALAAFQGDQLDHRRSQAITMRLQRLNDGRGDYDDLVDIAHNLAATEIGQRRVGKECGYGWSV